MWVRRNDVSLTQLLLSVIPGWLDLEADPSSAGKLNRAMLGDNEEKTVGVPRQRRHGSEMYWSHTFWQVGGNIWWGLKRGFFSLDSCLALIWFSYGAIIIKLNCSFGGWNLKLCNRRVPKIDLIESEQNIDIWLDLVNS